MKLKLFTTEAERQRTNTRVLARFFSLMAVLALVFAVIIVGRYLLSWW